jgi:hypothetical protein
MSKSLAITSPLIPHTIHVHTSTPHHLPHPFSTCTPYLRIELALHNIPSRPYIRRSMCYSRRNLDGHAICFCSGMGRTGIIYEYVGKNMSRARGLNKRCRDSMVVRSWRARNCWVVCLCMFGRLDCLYIYMCVRVDVWVLEAY